MRREDAMYDYETLRHLAHDHRHQLELDARCGRVAAQARVRRVTRANERTRAVVVGRLLTERRHATT
jgi:hypothetical protein